MWTAEHEERTRDPPMLDWTNQMEGAELGAPHELSNRFVSSVFQMLFTERRRRVLAVFTVNVLRSSSQAVQVSLRTKDTKQQVIKEF